MYGRADIFLVLLSLGPFEDIVPAPIMWLILKFIDRNTMFVIVLFLCHAVKYSVTYQGRPDSSVGSALGF